MYQRIVVAVDGSDTGRRGVRRLLLGSAAERIARVASKPVLLVQGT